MPSADQALLENRRKAALAAAAHTVAAAYDKELGVNLAHQSEEFADSLRILRDLTDGLGLLSGYRDSKHNLTIRPPPMRRERVPSS
ncbi:MAG TPA: hypothetical protein VHB46_04465 [Burkholderiales bacterium]|nr:hypothetical protein [Burkholderiales bacterium]